MAAPFAPAPFAGTDDILLQARPPATDPLTYLTLLEYQLTTERLPLLHDVLCADEALAREIGWDLVRTLANFLPHSQACLDDVARLGNPREVMLSVAGALERLRGRLRDADADADALEEVEGEGEDDGLEGGPDGPASPALQYECLLGMLPTLQSRLSSKYPSRFLGSTLQEVLTTLELMPTPAATLATLRFLENVSGVKRPRPPPRDAATPVSAPAEGAAPPAGDPESEEPSAAVVVAQRQIMKRLAQFALLECIKIYLGGLPEGPNGMRWALRMEEARETRPIPPHLLRLCATEAYKHDPELQERDAVFLRMLDCARELGIADSELVCVCSTRNGKDDAVLDLESVPQRPEEIHLERHGCLLLLAGRMAVSRLDGSNAAPHVFLNTLAELVTCFGGNCNNGIPDDEAAVDALLAVTAGSLATAGEGALDVDDARFEQVLRIVANCTATDTYRDRTSLSNIPARLFQSAADPEQRYRILRTFVTERGEPCDNLKETILRWIKSEVMRMNEPPRQDSQPASCLDASDNLSQLVHATFAALPQGFPVLAAEMPPRKRLVRWMASLEQALPVYLGYINLYLFLLKSPQVNERVDFAGGTHAQVLELFFKPMQAGLRNALDDLGRIAEADNDTMEQDVVVQCIGGLDVALLLVGQIERWECT
ncbi:hypothetical protein KEM52_004991 [Ascosphaera acerosa]|nr:hypothetical protein KEM52_004991 [Ascosphaera acerosa]